MTNDKCPLLLHDLYNYDIVSAYPTILGKQFFDFEGIDLEDKEKRNIFIGKKQIGNQPLSSFLLESVDNLVKFYLRETDDEDIITIQRDGFILKKPLDDNDKFIEVKLRDYIDFFIFSYDRSCFLYCVDEKIVVKGVSYLYNNLDKIYQLYAKLNFYDKSTLFQQLENIKKEILFSEDKSLFMIPKGDDKFIISTYKGDIEIKDPDVISIQSINKMKYYKHFFRPFSQSLFLELY